MINKDVYDKLKKEYGRSSSWAVWSEPKNSNWCSKDSIEDMSLFKDEEALLKLLNGKYIFVGYNPAEHDITHNTTNWTNFHSDDSRRSQDHKLRYALKDTDCWGAFLTDLFRVVETDSKKVTEMVGKRDEIEGVENIMHIRDALGANSTVVAMHGNAYEVLKKHLPKDVDLKRIYHYSSRQANNLEEYRLLVHEQLGI